jgi:competence protein ComEC
MILFWREHPALLIALSFLFGATNLLLSLFWALYLLYLRSWHVLILLGVALLYSWALTPAPTKTNQAYFTISQLKNFQTPFHKGYLYKGFAWLETQKVPCTVFSAKHHPADRDYVLSGNLVEDRFKAKTWTPVPNTTSLAEWRYQLKEQFRKFLSQKLSPKPATFLSSLITGDVEERTLRFEFSRLGLQHILAISGFHFAILILACSYTLGLFLPERPKILLLILTINAYFFFVGPIPSVQRSYLAALCYLIGKLLRRKTTGLNLLGVAMLTELLLDPLAPQQLGFQLSYLSCAGLLLLMPILPKYPNPIRITLAVNIPLLPLLLYHFHKFPLLSLLYNLFFPFLVSLSLYLLLLSLLFPFLFPLLDFFTTQLLDLVAYPPCALNYVLSVPHFPFLIIPPYLLLIFLISYHLKKKLVFTNY